MVSQSDNLAAFGVCNMKGRLKHIVLIKIKILWLNFMFRSNNQLRTCPYYVVVLLLEHWGYPRHAPIHIYIYIYSILCYFPSIVCVDTFLGCIIYLIDFWWPILLAAAVWPNSQTIYAAALLRDVMKSLGRYYGARGLFYWQSSSEIRVWIIAAFIFFGVNYLPML